MSIPTAERRQFKVGKYDVVARPIPVLPPLKPYQVFCRRGKKKPPTAPSN